MMTKGCVGRRRDGNELIQCRALATAREPRGPETDALAAAIVETFETIPDRHMNAAGGARHMTRDGFFSPEQAWHSGESFRIRNLQSCRASDIPRLATSLNYAMRSSSMSGAGQSGCKERR